MEHLTERTDLELLNLELNNEEQLIAYKTPFDNYKPGLLPAIFGTFLVTCGNVVYGNRPSYLKFRAVEVIARVPYHSWSSAAFTLLTLFYRDEFRAMHLSFISKYARIAQDNETMHVVVVSHLAEREEKAGIIRHTLIPMLFAFFYYVVSYLLYMLRPRWSYELNYIFEQHAFDQYSEFLESYADALKSKPMNSEFLTWYGRNPISQYEFFRSARNDELIHRNQSIKEIDVESDAHRVQILTYGSLFILLVLLFVLLF